MEFLENFLHMKKLPNSTKAELAMNQNADSMHGKTNSYFRWNLGVFPIEKHKNILDLGCGSGMYFNEIMRYSPSLYVATDYSEKYVKQMKTFTGHSLNSRVFQLDLMDSNIAKTLNGYKFDYVFLFDVLEHLKDDRQALKNIYSMLESCEATYLFLRVPALQFIYGANDRAIGHHRRYSTKSLKMLLESCSFHVDLIRYQNFIGIIPWYIIGNILKRSLAVSSTEGSVFNHMVPLVKFVEGFFSPPIGLSLYCVCTIRK